MESPLILMRHKDSSDGRIDMQMIGTFLSFASRGDRVGLNQMLRQGISPNVQDYDKRTALHLAASEGHASIVELLLAYKADVNLKDRWRRTTVRHEGDSIEVNIDISELNMQHSSMIEQGLFGESEKVKWRGTWVVKTAIKRVFSAKVNTLLRELRHPNILQFLGSIVHGDEMILITEYLPKGNLQDILGKRLDPPTALRYALDIARGMNYIHRHKPLPIVHNNLHPKNLLLDEGGHLKIGEYWVQILDNQIYANQDCCQVNNGCNFISHLRHDISKDIYSFGLIFYQMLEGRQITDRTSSEPMHIKSVDLEKKLYTGRYPSRILQLIEDCTSTVPSTRPSFATVIEILEEVSLLSRKTGCPPCNKSKSPK
ncbi:integrin-linked protein kinase 1-like isoform X2 [Lycium ferocissimum]|uniref:integrin-linked protein kinase 1-like isoform X2 n=1 Tax=Lycium ferocissimum TaxID=112874 RepID=UPI002814E96A|nr:integrin-linked protein kinase 1-like isoform X2 [Lycium ferocissimum]